MSTYPPAPANRIVRVVSTYIRHGLQYRVHDGATPVGPLFDDRDDAERWAENYRSNQ